MLVLSIMILNVLLTYAINLTLNCLLLGYHVIKNTSCEEELSNKKILIIKICFDAFALVIFILSVVLELINSRTNYMETGYTVSVALLILSNILSVVDMFRWRSDN